MNANMKNKMPLALSRLCQLQAILMLKNYCTKKNYCGGGGGGDGDNGGDAVEGEGFNPAFVAHTHTLFCIPYTEWLFTAIVDQ